MLGRMAPGPAVSSASSSGLFLQSHMVLSSAGHLLGSAMPTFPGVAAADVACGPLLAHARGTITAAGRKMLRRAECGKPLISWPPSPRLRAPVAQEGAPEAE